MKYTVKLQSLFLGIVLLTNPTMASDRWPDWRGPTADGHSDATGLPLHWSETKNIVWKTPIHDHGHSTPVVWDDQIWLTTATEDGKTLYAVCIDFNTGKILHDIEVFHPENPQRIHPNNTYATPSGVIEEGRIYVHYGTFGTAALNSQTGEVVWRRNDLNCEHMQGPASSPILYKDLIILHLEGTDLQYIVALDKTTGDTVWRCDRPKELYETIKTAVYLKAYHTPILVDVNGQTQMISNGALLVTGHNPLTGEELWRVRYGEDSTISRVVSGHGLFFVNCGGSPNRTQLWAVRQGGHGDVTDTHVVWKMTRNVPLESSPVLVDDLLYTVSDNGALICTQALTGDEVWQERLSERHGASLLYADKRIYLSSKTGKTRVIKPGREYVELAVNQLDGELWASPAVAGRSLLLRTKTHLYRIQDE
ncbi:MAG: PQQ-binding-like beta-propeller repeat protein [Candidatus Omnitrophica bacterium]|nr:PQQ-binding-like beta-propeller repeat protein [Candidatus Omnitrophota bacterium]